MNSDDFRRNELIHFEKNSIELFGRRLVMLSVHALEQLIADIISEFGDDPADAIVNRFAFYWGYADASAMKRSFSWESESDHLRSGCRLMEIAGISSPAITSLKVDSETHAAEITIEWPGPGRVDPDRKKTEPAHQILDKIITGYMSGFSSYCFDRDIWFQQVIEKKQKTTECRAIGKDRNSWGRCNSEIKGLWETDDIEEHIQKLAGHLILETRKREQKRRDAALLSPEMGPYFMDFQSRQLKSVLYMADRVARFNTSVLITGESGVGKEILSTYIHKKSPREDAAFVTVNCSALPETLLESELFGHKAGSYTGAVKDRIGLFEGAANGTIFLDEIGDITPATQLKLLRVLQEKEIVRVGENEPRKVDVRIIAATNKDLDKAISQGTFRDDLLYRLRVVEIEVPPLRERREDILPLARYIIRKLASKMEIENLSLTTRCIDYLNGFSWPGNVRELENALERAAVFCDNGEIRPEDLPSHVTRPSEASTDPSSTSSRTLSEMERAHIINVLGSTGWNKTRAAVVLGISSSTLWRKMNEYKINK